MQSARARLLKKSLSVASCQLIAEFLGSLLLAAAVIGSGIMGERMADGNLAVALLANTFATVAALATLIALLGPISGAHFNPAISVIDAIRGKMSGWMAAGYVLAQIAGCCTGAILANAMFELSLLQESTRMRGGGAQWLSEVIATAGLVLVVLGAPTISAAAWRVPAWIGAAYWFTASTSFANPAITIGRSLSDTFAGIRPADAPAFVASQFAGALVALLLFRIVYDQQRSAPPR